MAIGVGLPGRSRTLEQIEGLNPIREALRAARPLTRILVLKQRDRALERLLQLARQHGVPVQEVTRQHLDQIARSRSHQGVVALTAAAAYTDLDLILERAQAPGNVPLLIALDEVQDPHNLGAVIRTADAAGVDGIILPTRRAAGLTPGALKAAAGAVEYVPVARVGNLVRALTDLKQRHLWVVGADADAGDVFWHADLKEPLVLVIGGEEKGLRRLVKETCDYLVRIPMTGAIESLNASVAAALLMFEVRRQRCCPGNEADRGH